MTDFKLLKKYNRAFTFVEVMVALLLTVIIVGSVYKLFFSEVKSIHMALEHIGVNENARQFFALFGNDVRNTNWIDFPVPIPRDNVSGLKPKSEGTVCVLRRQIMDFNEKPGTGTFLQHESIEYFLKPSKNGGSDLFRRITLSSDKTSSKRSEKKISEGIGEMLVFTTMKKDIKIGMKSMGKSQSVVHPSYESDGTGPYLLHVRATFLRGGNDKENSKNIVHYFNTCFNVRGKLNGVIP